MNTRLLRFLEAENITQSQFADALGITRATVSHILSGRNRPGFEFLESLALRYPELNLEWLITGRGRMNREKQPENVPPVPTVSLSNPRKVAKIVVFYDDNSFEEFTAH